MLQRFKKMGKRDGDARRMLTGVSGSPAVAPIKSIHQYFSFSLGAGRMRVGFLVPKKKRKEQEACRAGGKNLHTQRALLTVVPQVIYESR